MHQHDRHTTNDYDKMRRDKRNPLRRQKRIFLIIAVVFAVAKGSLQQRHSCGRVEQISADRGKLRLRTVDVMESETLCWDPTKQPTGRLWCCTQWRRRRDVINGQIRNFSKVCCSIEYKRRVF